MAVKTELIINSLIVQYSLDGLDNVVIQVGTTLSGHDSGIATDFENTFTISAPVSSSFTPFADLTEADVANFVKATERYTTLITSLTAEIEELKIPPTTGTLHFPWA